MTFTSRLVRAARAIVRPGASDSSVGADELARRLRKLERQGGLILPLPGHGETSARHERLYEISRIDVSLARVAEAHTDAVAILAEANVSAREHALYGVWASDGPKSRLTIDKNARGELVLNGVKRYCSGSSFLDAALVTAYAGDALLLIDVPLDAKGLAVDTTEWASPAFASTATGTVTFKNVHVSESQIIGPSGWYLSRPGFWHGAVGPAACWAGGAAGLVDAARALGKKDPHSRAQLGALEAAAWGMLAVLDRAGREIDADPMDTSQRARQRALSARHLIERACTDVLDRFGRATGPQLLAYDAGIAQRHAEVGVYIRQSHAERDLESLAEPAGP